MRISPYNYWSYDPVSVCNKSGPCMENVCKQFLLRVEHSLIWRWYILWLQHIRIEHWVAFQNCAFWWMNAVHNVKLEQFLTSPGPNAGSISRWWPLLGARKWEPKRLKQENFFFNYKIIFYYKFYYKTNKNTNINTR